MIRAIRSSAVQADLVAFGIFAILGPIALTIYAFEVSPDSLERARVVLLGSELIIAALVAGLALRVSYNLGIRKAGEYFESAPDHANVM